MAHKFKTGARKQVRNVCLSAGEEIVDAQHIVALCNEPVAKMGAEEAGSASHQYSFQCEPPDEHHARR
jgi:hypothetical protein